MTIAVIAEKPSVGRDLAKVLGATKPGQGYLQGNGYVVTWAVGHLVTIAEPHVMNEKWKKWCVADLPMLPEAWRLTTYEKLKDQFEVVRRILVSESVERIICATDAGREGELIFRYIYETAGCDKPVDRLWISSLTHEAIAAGFKALRSSTEFDNLAAAARARSRADWLVGLNLSRLYSLRSTENYSVGRVQTPTLAMIVDRERAIQVFVPEDYGEVHLTLGAGAQTFPAVIVEAPNAKSTGLDTGDDQKDPEPAFPGLTAEKEGSVREGFSWASVRAQRFSKGGGGIKRLVKHLQTVSTGVIHWQQSKKNKVPAPMLYDLTELQRQANRLYGYSAQQVLELAQALYEKRKLITYPRTDSRHLTKDVAVHLPKLLTVLAGNYPEATDLAREGRPLGRRFVDDGAVTDHHAIIPTPVQANVHSLPEGEARVYDLIARRLLAAWYPDHVVAVSHVVTQIQGPEKMDPSIFTLSTGTVIEETGWKDMELGGSSAKPSRAKKKAALGDVDHGIAPLGFPNDSALPKGLTVGKELVIKSFKEVDKSTRPPQRLNDATLLTAMESAGKSLTDKRLSDAMKERGLGTPATRASIIELLLHRQYVRREGKAFHATDKGIKLIDLVDSAVKSPEMTGTWEARLKDMEKGKQSFETFMRDVEQYVGEVVGRARRGGSGQSPVSVAASGRETRLNPPISGQVPSPPSCSSFPLEGVLKQRFHHDTFLPYQKEAIEQILAGKNVLIVMPTGAGKSLCYQLPALAKGRCAVVVSPLIALMEDQVFKLRRLGIRAHALHGGMTREESRAVCVDYLQGRCDLLYITPERLGVHGFPEMLAKSPPVLIAIDEAHCISQWGHDFRPDYRMIRERLRPLAQVPLVAVTATATTEVRGDILQQLGRESWELHVHGFWRDNLALRVVQCKSKDRLSKAVELLLQTPSQSNPVMGATATLPAIVYAPTRKGAEEWAAGFSAAGLKAVVYHAGLPQEDRRLAQERFLSDKVEVIVATIAFGMGVDKPNVRMVIHAAMPASVESYYQEVGRAGRDGHPASCVLFASDEDMRNHNYHIQKDYPLVEKMEQVLQRVGTGTNSREALSCALKFDEELLNRCLEKLWLHGALVVKGDDQFALGQGGWVVDYLAQRDERVGRLGLMLEYCRTAKCRMLTVVSYFGDARADASRCGKCDRCRAPEAGEVTTLSRGLKPFADLILDPAAQMRSAKLKEWRKRVSQAEGLPLYRVLNNETLDALARRCPLTTKQLKEVKGMGPKLQQRYGAEIVRLLVAGESPSGRGAAPLNASI